MVDIVFKKITFRFNVNAKPKQPVSEFKITKKCKMNKTWIISKSIKRLMNAGEKTILKETIKWGFCVGVKIAAEKPLTEDFF